MTQHRRGTWPGSGPGDRRLGRTRLGPLHRGIAQRFAKSTARRVLAGPSAHTPVQTSVKALTRRATRWSRAIRRGRALQSGSDATRATTRANLDENQGLHATQPSQARQANCASCSPPCPASPMHRCAKCCGSYSDCAVEATQARNGHISEARRSLWRRHAELWSCGLGEEGRPVISGARSGRNSARHAWADFGLDW